MRFNWGWRGGLEKCISPESSKHRLETTVNRPLANTTGTAKITYFLTSLYVKHVRTSNLHSYTKNEGETKISFL